MDFHLRRRPCTTTDAGFRPSVLRHGIACGQRGWKWQPGGGAIGLGTSPPTGMRARPVISRSGIASISARRPGRPVSSSLKAMRCDSCRSATTRTSPADAVKTPKTAGSPDHSAATKKDAIVTASPTARGETAAPLCGQARQTAAMTAATSSSGDWQTALAAEVDRLLARDNGNLHELLTQQFERILIARALAHTGGRRIEAAQALGIGRNTITRKIQELALDDSDD